MKISTKFAMWSALFGCFLLFVITPIEVAGTSPTFALFSVYIGLLAFVVSIVALIWRAVDQIKNSAPAVSADKSAPSSHLLGWVFALIVGIAFFGVGYYATTAVERMFDL